MVPIMADDVVDVQNYRMADYYSSMEYSCAGISYRSMCIVQYIQEANSPSEMDQTLDPLFHVAIM